MSFPPETIDLLASTEEIVLVTRSRARSHRTVLWVAVDESEVFIRSVRGDVAAWYRRVRADPLATLEVGDVRLLVRARGVPDAGGYARASAAFRRKYPPGQTLSRRHRSDLAATSACVVCRSSSHRLRRRPVVVGSAGSSIVIVKRRGFGGGSRL